MRGQCFFRGSGRDGRFKAEDLSAEYVSIWYWRSQKILEFLFLTASWYLQISFYGFEFWVDQSETSTLEQPADNWSIIYFFPTCTKNAVVSCVHPCQDTFLKKSLLGKNHVHDGKLCRMSLEHIST